MRRDSRELVDIKVCPILTPPLQSVLDNTRAKMDVESLPQTEPFDIEAASGNEGKVSIHSHASEGSADEFTVEVAGESYSYSAENFFQANQSLIPDLISTALGDFTGALAVDLYAGVGLFSLTLARRFKNVIAVEGSRSSVDLARRNAAAAGLGNIELHSAAVGDFLRTHDMGTPDQVLLDPPRSGPEDGVIAAIAAMLPRRVSYISCDPAILARDLRELVMAGFAIDSITALDLFPQTHHVETVVHLSG
jgi:23S rRNA (uracil1939-C5)-methyltransferase